METTDTQADRLARQYEHRVGFFTRQVQRRYMLGSRWTDELVSAGYWGLFRALDNRRPEAHENELSAYVSRRIQGAVIDAARACLNHSARREFCAGVPGQEESEDLFAGSAAEVGVLDRHTMDPERLATDSAKQDRIRAALAVLSDDERETLVAYMEGASLSEIARERRIALATMQARFKKTTRKLRAKAPTLRRVLLDQDCA